MLLIIEILRLVHGLAQQAPKATTHVWGLGVARFWLIAMASRETEPKIEGSGWWGQNIASGEQQVRKSLMLLWRQEQEQQHYQQQWQQHHQQEQYEKIINNINNINYWVSIFISQFNHSHFFKWSPNSRTLEQFNARQSIKHCQRHYGPRRWLLWPVILVW